MNKFYNSNSITVNVMIEAVAHCAVAISTYYAILGSASATAAGVIDELSAVTQPPI